MVEMPPTCSGVRALYPNDATRDAQTPMKAVNSVRLSQGNFSSAIILTSNHNSTIDLSDGMGELSIIEIEGPWPEYSCIGTIGISYYYIGVRPDLFA
jgi:hypothetical protein